MIFAPDCIGPNIESLVAKMKPGDVMLLENLRFHSGEETNDETFSKSLAALGDVYINDAFGAAHRAHASTVGITKYIPVAAAGFLLKEIEYLEGAVENPVRPFVAILGGAKVSGKIGVIENLGKRVDKVIIGGGMATLKAKGLEIGNSLVENDMLDFARASKTMRSLAANSISRSIASSPPVATAPKPRSSRCRKFPRAGMPSTSVRPRSSCLRKLCRMPRHHLGRPDGRVRSRRVCARTLSIAHAIADAYALTIVGGGETAMAIHRAGESENISFISTGGGAALELLEGKPLPGLVALPERND